MADLEENVPDSSDFIEVTPEDGQSDEVGDVSSTTPSTFDPIPSEENSPLIDINDAIVEKKEEEEEPAPAEDTVVPDEKNFPETVGESKCTSTKELTSCPARWMKEHGVSQRAIDLIYWRCWKKTAIVFATLLVVLISLSMYTLLSVLTFFSMAILTVALLYRVGMTVMGAIQKSGTDNPFKNILEKDVEISKEKAVELIEGSVDHINCAAKELRRLFLVEDIVDSIKFGLFLWVLSYVGAWFNALTILILGVALLFTVPRVYEDHQTKIDEYLSVAMEKVSGVVSQIKAKLPAKFQKEKTS